jgi:flagellar motor component MotA|tara:strand:- start:139 stop:465 length:327 start_codon:yes stop_codon:yes gene_type:complete
MKKLILLGLIVWLSLNAFANSVKADTKTEAIIGHVITQAIQGNDMDHAEVMGNELKLLMHKYSIEMTHVLLQHMPNILDSISAQLRLELDKQYKCSLQSEDYKNKECE